MIGDNLCNLCNTLNIYSIIILINFIGFYVNRLFTYNFIRNLRAASQAVDNRGFHVSADFHRGLPSDVS